MPYAKLEDRQQMGRRRYAARKDEPRFKEVNRVRAIARYHIKEKQPCSIGGCKNMGERHHPDYKKPLEVVWLCNFHHDELHKIPQRLCSVVGCKNKHRARGLCANHYEHKHRPYVRVKDRLDSVLNLLRGE